MAYSWSVRHGYLSNFIKYPRREIKSTGAKPVLNILTLLLCSFTLNRVLMIRFQRIGRKNDPAFRIVVTEKRSKPKSGELEILGSYHPKTKAVVLKNERILFWISKGAKLSDTVHNLFVAQGAIQGKKINVVRTERGETSSAVTQGEKIPHQKEEKGVTTIAS